MRRVLSGGADRAALFEEKMLTACKPVAVLWCFPVTERLALSAGTGQHFVFLHTWLCPYVKGLNIAALFVTKKERGLRVSSVAALG